MQRRCNDLRKEKHQQGKGGRRPATVDGQVGEEDEHGKRRERGEEGEEGPGRR